MTNDNRTFFTRALDVLANDAGLAVCYLHDQYPAIHVTDIVVYDKYTIESRRVKCPRCEREKS